MEYKGIVLDDFEIYTTEYIDRLQEPNDITKPNVFTGLIKYLNRNIIKGNRDILKDINILDCIWLYYTDICYSYNQRPNILEYCLLIGINQDTFYEWIKSNTYNDVCKRLNRTRSETLKTWQEETKLARMKGAEQGNVGCIFLCKAVDGLTDTPKTVININTTAQSLEALPSLAQLTDKKRKQ